MKASRSKKHCALFRAIAIVAALAFIFDPFSLGALAGEATLPLFPGSDRGGEENTGPIKDNLYNLDMPMSMGYIREVYRSDSDKPVILYIQDAHCNYSCQRSIDDIIDFFNEKYSVNVAAVEGGAGQYDFSIFTSIPDIDIREKVADYFMKEGRVTGVEYFAIMNPDRIVVKGLENRDLYEKNLGVYRESMGYKDEIVKYMGMLKHYINNLKRPIYSDEIKKLDDTKKAHEDNKLQFKDYVLYIESVTRGHGIDINRFKNLKKLLSVMDEEKEINFARAQAERETLIDQLMKKMSRLEISTMIKMSLAYKKGDMKPADYYDYLFKKANASFTDMTEYPNLVKYKNYLERYDSVEKDVFFEELFELELYVAANLFINDDERALFSMDDNLGLLDRLFSVSLTRHQYDYFMNNRDDIKASKYADFINNKAPWYNITANVTPDVKALDSYTNKISQFYDYSFKRDEAFMENISRYGKDQKAMFMVTGGFHTENVKELLKKNGYSYVLITPKLTQEKYNPYFQLLAGGLSPIETVLSQYTSALALKSPLSEMASEKDRQSLINMVFILSQELRDAKAQGRPLSSLAARIPADKSATQEEVVLIFTPDREVAASFGKAEQAGVFEGQPVFWSVVPKDAMDRLSADNVDIVTLTEAFIDQTYQGWKDQLESMKSSQDNAAESAAAPALAGVPSGTAIPEPIDQYVNDKNSIMAKSLLAVAPDFKAGVVVEVDMERAFQDLESKQAENIRHELQSLIERRLKGLLQHKGQISFRISTSRSETRDIVSRFIEKDNIRPVVFTIANGNTQVFPSIGTAEDFERDIFGDNIGTLKERLINLFPAKARDELKTKLSAGDLGNIIPWVPMNMPAPVSGDMTDPRNLVAVDFDYMCLMGILMDESNAVVQSGGVITDENLRNYIAGIVELKAAIEKEKAGEVPKDINEFLYNGKFYINLPAITKIDVNANYKKWYDTFHKVSIAA